MWWRWRNNLCLLCGRPKTLSLSLSHSESNAENTASNKEAAATSRITFRQTTTKKYFRSSSMHSDDLLVRQSSKPSTFHEWKRSSWNPNLCLFIEHAQMPLHWCVHLIILCTIIYILQCIIFVTYFFVFGSVQQARQRLGNQTIASLWVNNLRPGAWPIVCPLQSASTLLADTHIEI